MAISQRWRVKIYHSKTHLVVTLFVIIIPFLFLLLFSSFAKIATSKLFLDMFISIGRLFVAYIIAVLLGWTFAVLFFKGRRSAVALPVFDVLQSFPTFAALPLATHLWGHSNFTVIIFLIFTIIWPIFFSILSSLKLVKHDWEEAVEIAGFSGFSYLWHFLLPISIPGLITGSIVGLGEGWEALVATEIIVGVEPGLGNFFGLFARNSTITIFGILGFLMVIFSINKLIWLPLLERSHLKMSE